MDYPEGAYEAFADRVGEPGAFGDPVKTNAGFETAKRAKARAAQAAQAAAERARREAEEAARRAQEEQAAQEALALLKSLMPGAVDALAGEITARTAQARAATQEAAGTLAANAAKAVTDRLDEEWEGFTAALDKPETLGKRLGGSTGARLVELLGRRFVLKGGASPEHLASEQAADEAYRAAGIKVPEQRTVVSKGGRRYKLADFAEGERLADWWRAKGRTEAEREALRAKLRAGLDVDAMLGNWDVIGMGGDNILVDKDGEPWRIDNGGALGFRAQGARKADADWKDGWPNELFTIAGSANNAPYVGGTSSLSLIRQAAARDWEKVVAALPDQADRDALTRRVAEMRQLAARADDFARGGYEDAFAERVVEHSFNLSKEGFREEVPKTIKHGDYGFCRSKPSTAGLVGGEPGEEYGSLALAAAKTVGTHQKDGNYNQATLNAFYAKEPELKAILKADPKNAGAAHYLKAMQQIKDAVANQSALPHIDTSVKVRAPKTERKPAPKYTSLTDHIAQYMAAHGADYGFIKKWASDQANDSWDPHACRLKICEMDSRGLDWRKKKAPGVFFGIRNQATHLNQAIKYYTANPAALTADRETFAQYKAAIQLVLENADFRISAPGGQEVSANDPVSRTIRLLRTENRGIIPANTKTGDDAHYDIGANESFTLATVYKYKGVDGVIVAVPYSRVNGLWCLERTPGHPLQGFFAGDHENEVNAATDGLRRVFIENPPSGKSNAMWYNLLE